MRQRLSSIDPRLLTILLIVFVQMVGASLVLPILPLFAKNRFDMQPQTITLLVSSFFAAQFLAGPTIGRLSDRHGRLPVLIISQIGTAVSFVMLVIAGGPIMLFASRILDGITGGNIIVAQAYITDITPREKRTQSLGLIFAAFGLGFTIGPALGGTLMSVFGPEVPFMLAAVAATLTVLLTWRTLDETLSPEERAANRLKGAAAGRGVSARDVVGNGALMIILAIGFIGQFALGLLQSTFALYGEAVLFARYDARFASMGVGLLLGTAGLTQIVTQVFVLRRAIARFGEARLVLFGSISRALGLLLLAAIITPWLGPLAMVFFASGMGVMMPSLQSLATTAVDDRVRGGVLGLFQSAVNLSTIFGTALGGVLFAIRPSMPYWIGGALAAAVIPAALFLRDEESKPASGAEAVVPT